MRKRKGFEAGTLCYAVIGMGVLVWISVFFVSVKSFLDGAVVGLEPSLAVGCVLLVASMSMADASSRFLPLAALVAVLSMATSLMAACALCPAPPVS